MDRDPHPPIKITFPYMRTIKNNKFSQNQGGGLEPPPKYRGVATPQRAQPLPFWRLCTEKIAKVLWLN